MYRLLPETSGAFVALQFTGKLDADNYKAIIPILEEHISRHGKISLLWEMRDFGGWTTDGLLSDTKFDVKHRNDFSRIAMVGEKKWQDWMTSLMKPFTSAKVRYFESDERDAALAWAKESHAR